jgi:hypothetical protein
MARGAHRRGRQKHRRVGHEPAIAEEVMLVEHETFPAQLFGELDLLQDLLIVNVVRWVEIGIIGCQNVDVKAQGLLSRQFATSRLLKNLSESFDGAQGERRRLTLRMIFRS